MKPLSELGISPTPWNLSGRCNTVVLDRCNKFIVHDSPYTNKYRPGGEMVSDSRLIAAAPELYESCLWCLKQANDIGAASLGGEVNTSALAMSMAGIVRRCEKALARASGEEDENGNA